MKNLIYCITLCFISLSSFSQYRTDLVKENFDSTSHIVYLDSLSSDTLWHVGKPNKSTFTEAFSQPFAIVTDTLHSYPNTTTGCFYVNILPANAQQEPYFAVDYWEAFCLDLEIRFKHKLQCDTLTEGGWIEISSDSGETFKNIVLASVSFGGYGTNFYNQDAAINDSIPGFTGTTADWVESTFIIQGIIPVKSPGNYYVLKFCFMSDDDSTGKDGWMIDDIHINTYDWGMEFGCSGVEESDGLHVKIYPVPATDYVFVESPGNEKLYASIIDISGKKIQENVSISSQGISIQNLPTGIYLLKIKNAEGKEHIQKIIKQ